MSVDFAFVDSGTGGLPYMCYLNNKSPLSTCIYVADAQNFPYGEKTSEQVKRCAISVCKKIIERFDPKVIVIACNTMSVTALAALREEFSIPFIGTVPAIKLASSVTQNKRIGLLATNRAVNENYTKQLIKDYASDCEVFLRGDGTLISFIEHNLTTATKEQKLDAVKPAVEFFAQNNVDTIILGCTHFIHFADEISQVAGSNVKVIDSREGVVKQALKQLGNVDGSLPNNIQNKTFFITGTPDSSSEQDYQNIAKKFSIPWGGSL